jgi:hypothetical protein
LEVVLLALSLVPEYQRQLEEMPEPEFCGEDWQDQFWDL